MRYLINYNVGYGNKLVEGTLEKAMKLADDGIRPTQKPVTIEDDGGNKIASRLWHDENFASNNDGSRNPISFGRLGYYSDWLFEEERNNSSNLEQVANEVCDNLCKYRETTDDDMICDYMREHGSCPLEKLVKGKEGKTWR